MKKDQIQIMLIFEARDPSYETELPHRKANLEKIQNKIPNHLRLKNKTNSNQNNKNQIWYKN